MASTYYCEVSRFRESVKEIVSEIKNDNVREFARKLYSETRISRFSKWSLVLKENKDQFEGCFKAVSWSVLCAKEEVSFTIDRKNFDFKEFFHAFHLKLEEVKFPFGIEYDITDHLTISDGTDGYYVVSINDGKIRYIPNKNLDDTKDKALKEQS